MEVHDVTKRIFASKKEGRKRAEDMLNVYLEQFKVAKEKNQPDVSEDYMNKLLGSYGILETLGLISYKEWDELTSKIINKNYTLEG